MLGFLSLLQKNRKRNVINKQLWRCKISVNEPIHPPGSSVNSAIFENFSKFWPMFWFSFRVSVFENFFYIFYFLPNYLKIIYWHIILILNKEIWATLRHFRTLFYWSEYSRLKSFYFLLISKLCRNLNIDKSPYSSDLLANI